MKNEISLRFTRHALEKLFQRAISPMDCQTILKEGKIIEDYPNDKPFPSQLYLGHVKSRPLHIVVAFENTIAHVVTAYEPDPAIWDKNFERRRKL